MSKAGVFTLILVCIALKYGNDYLVDLIESSTTKDTTTNSATSSSSSSSSSSDAKSSIVVFTPDQLNSDKNVLLLALLGQSIDALCSFKCCSQPEEKDEDLTLENSFFSFFTFFYSFFLLKGRVYDVTKGAKHYGPGGSYQFFVGK